MKILAVPKDVICGKDLGDFRVLIFLYLLCKRTYDDTVMFNLKNLCEWSNVSPNRKKGNINDKYLTTIKAICDAGYFSDHTEFDKVNLSNIYKVYELKVNVDMLDNMNKFGMISLYELKKILNFKEELRDSGIDTSRISSYKILILLSYVRLNMYKKKDKPMCCYRLYKTISEDTGLSERYIGKIVAILDYLKIIKVYEGKIRKNKNNLYNPPKIFADYKHFDKNGEEIVGYDVDEEIKKQMMLLKISAKDNNN